MHMYTVHVTVAMIRDTICFAVDQKYFLINFKTISEILFIINE